MTLKHFIGFHTEGLPNPDILAKIQRLGESYSVTVVVSDSMRAEFIPDRFETRRVYCVPLPGYGTLFASRIDLLRPFVSSTPNLATIASQWRYVNSFGHGTIFADVSRMPPNQQKGAETVDPTEAMVAALQTLRGRDVVLSLSGGLDSRTMMALLHGADVPFRTMTYGVPTMPDWQTAERTSTADEISWQGLDVRSLTPEHLWHAMEETAMISEGTYNIAHAAVLPTLSRLYPNAVFVDGAYGGLLRGGLANQLLVRGRADLVTMDAKRIERWLLVRDLSVFHPDVHQEMTLSSQRVLQEALDGMPDFDPRHGREWIDEFFLRWYVPGFVSNPQRIYDRWITSEMPFLNPNVVDAVLATSGRSRNHARLFRTWVRRFRPSLTATGVVGKQALIPWMCAGNPWLTALYSTVGPKHRRADSGQMEHAVLDSVRNELSTIVDVVAASSAVPFQLPYIKELTRSALDHRDPSAAQPFFMWLTLALALRR